MFTVPWAPSTLKLEFKYLALVCVFFFFLGWCWFLVALLVVIFCVFWFVYLCPPPFRNSRMTVLTCKYLCERDKDQCWRRRRDHSKWDEQMCWCWSSWPGPEAALAKCHCQWVMREIPRHLEEECWSASGGERLTDWQMDLRAKHL